MFPIGKKLSKTIKDKFNINSFVNIFFSLKIKYRQKNINKKINKKFVGLINGPKIFEK